MILLYIVDALWAIVTGWFIGIYLLARRRPKPQPSLETAMNQTLKNFGYDKENDLILIYTLYHKNLCYYVTHDPDEVDAFLLDFCYINVHFAGDKKYSRFTWNRWHELRINGQGIHYNRLYQVSIPLRGGRELPLVGTIPMCGRRIETKGTMAHDHEAARKLTKAQIDAMTDEQVLDWMGATEEEKTEALLVPYDSLNGMRNCRMALECCTDEFGDKIAEQMDRQNLESL